jgi:AcrR family transcriptional regulator
MTNAPRSERDPLSERELLASVPEGDRYELPTPGTDRGRATRSRLLDAAEVVFYESGYDQASIVAITQRAGIAMGSFYTYFPSKHVIFVELVKRFSVDVRRSLAIASSRATQTRADVERSALEAWFAYVLEHPALYTMVHESRVVAPELHRWWYEEFSASYVENFDRLTPNHGADVDTEMLAYVFLGIADMLAMRWGIWAQEMPPPSVVDQLFVFISRGLDGILGPTASPGTAG